MTMNPTITRCAPIGPAVLSTAVLLVVLQLAGWLAPALAVDRVEVKRTDAQGQERITRVSGKLLVKAEDGGLLLVAPDGMLWNIEPQEVAAHTQDERNFEPLNREQLTEQLLRDLPEGFSVHSTAHYLVCYNTSQAYAQWCGSLYERLYRAFVNFWSRKGFELHEPEFPLVAIVFADSDSYREQAAEELGDAAKSIVGYYSLRSNRVMMYDLTGAEALRQPGDRRGSTAEINRMLSRPEAEPMVATIIHEATHQIAFNCGLQTRYSDVPVWLSEGLAVYFETPDLQSSQGWRSIGAVNRPRLAAFQQALPTRAAGSLTSLIADDKRMRDVRTAAGAYAEAWALNYFLIRHKPREFAAYLKMLSEKGQLVWDDEETRLAEFQKYFGDLQKLDADFLRTMRSVK